MRSLRVVVFVVLTIGAIFLVLSAERLWSEHDKTVGDQELAQSRSEWSRGTVALCFERSFTPVALTLVATAPPPFLQLIERQRTETAMLPAQIRSPLGSVTDFETRAPFFARPRHRDPV
jgi:hypothetical protein